MGMRTLVQGAGFCIAEGAGLVQALEGFVALPPPVAPYRVRRTYRYGRIAVTVICRDPDQENEE